MRSITSLSFLVVVGSTLAVPWDIGNHWQHSTDSRRGVAAVTAHQTAAATFYFTNNDFAGEVVPRPTASILVEPSAPGLSAAFSYSSISQQQQTQTKAVQSTAAPTVKTTTTTVTSDGSSDGTDYMSVVREWRAKMGVGGLSESDTLQANALKTVTDGKGQMVHELNPGSMAQVLAPGDTNNFENVFVGGWLCEIPSLPGLDGICSTMSAGWDYVGQTDHAEILSSTTYTKIGCALNNGIWGCDLA